MSPAGQQARATLDDALAAAPGSGALLLELARVRAPNRPLEPFSSRLRTLRAALWRSGAVWGGYAARGRGFGAVHYEAARFQTGRGGLGRCTYTRATSRAPSRPQSARSARAARRARHARARIAAPEAPLRPDAASGPRATERRRRRRGGGAGRALGGPRSGLRQASCVRHVPPSRARAPAPPRPPPRATPHRAVPRRAEPLGAAGASAC